VAQRAALNGVLFLHPVSRGAMSLITQIALLFIGATLTIIAAQVGTQLTLHRENKRKIAEWMKSVDENRRMWQMLVTEHPLHTHTEKQGPLAAERIKPMKVTV
jgi:hypothetical protein